MKLGGLYGPHPHDDSFEKLPPGESVFENARTSILLVEDESSGHEDGEEIRARNCPRSLTSHGMNGHGLRRLFVTLRQSPFIVEFNHLL